jgi:hypothetical protein
LFYVSLTPFLAAIKSESEREICRAIKKENKNNDVGERQAGKQAVADDHSNPIVIGREREWRKWREEAIAAQFNFYCPKIVIFMACYMLLSLYLQGKKKRLL